MISTILGTTPTVQNVQWIGLHHYKGNPPVKKLLDFGHDAIVAPRNLREPYHNVDGAPYFAVIIVLPVILN